MAKIPNALREPIGTAFPANVVLVGTIMPDGYVQISPRGSTLVFDDETIAFWDRGSGHTHDNMKDGDKVTLFFRDPELRARAYYRRAASPGFTAPLRSMPTAPPAMQFGTV